MANKDNFGAECMKGNIEENLKILAGETTEICLGRLISHLEITEEQSKKDHIGNLIFSLNMDVGKKANYLCFLHIIRFFGDKDVEMRLRSFLGYLIPKFHGVQEDLTEMVQNMIAEHTGDDGLVNIEKLAAAVELYKNPVGMLSF